MTDLRSLCARMADELDYYRQLLMDDRRETHALAAEARAALAEADGPAVPEGREPASVVGEPSDEELAQAAKAAIHDYKYQTELVYFLDSDSFEYEPFLLALRAAIAADRARAALAEPEPEGPTVMEIIELADEIEAAELGQVDLVRAALARWGNLKAGVTSSTPVPVSERLPGPEDCDAEGRCWFFIDGAQWAIDGAHWALEDRTYGCNRHRSHWLPAHALPLPAGEVE